MDLAHLRYVHGYDSVSRVGSVSVDGAFLESGFDFRRSKRIAGIMEIEFDVTAVTEIHGLGYSFVNIRQHSIGMDARLWVLATPVDGTLTEVTLVGQVREMRKPRRPIVGLRFLPLSLRARIMNRIILSAEIHDVLQDVVIWGRKQYRSRPRLCQSDGEIGMFRRYCSQFYSDLADSGQERPEGRAGQA